MTIQIRSSYSYTSENNSKSKDEEEIFYYVKVKTPQKLTLVKYTTQFRDYKNQNTIGLFELGEWMQGAFK